MKYRWNSAKESACQCSIPGSGRSPGVGNGMLYSPLLLTGRSHGQRSLEESMDKGAWKISWTEELGGLWSMGSQRVGHD